MAKTVQRSYRIAQELMPFVEDYKKKGKLKKLVEHAILLAIHEAQHETPLQREARYVCTHAPVKVQRRVLRMFMLARFHEVRELTPQEETFRSIMLQVIDSVEQWPGYDEVVKGLLPK